MGEAKTTASNLELILPRSTGTQGHFAQRARRPQALRWTLVLLGLRFNAANSAWLAEHFRLPRNRTCRGFLPRIVPPIFWLHVFPPPNLKAVNPARDS